MSRIIMFLILWILIGINSFSQGLRIDTVVGKYYLDSINYLQYDLIYSNLTSDTYILWIDRDNNDTITNDTKVRNYFYKIKGDFSLSNLLYEPLISEIQIGIYDSFYKLIKPNDKFTISILTKVTDSDMIYKRINKLKKQIVFMKSNESSRLPQLYHLEKLNYKNNVLNLFLDF